jgi:membrane associated rhomboid family serine protease
MFRHFQISEYTIQRGYLHTIITGSISHQELGHFIPNILGYFLFGKIIETKFGSRRTFYLLLISSVASIIGIAVLEKYFNDSVRLITPKCNGSVPAIALGVATLVRAPFVQFNPLRLRKTLMNEIFMIPMFIPALMLLFLEYYEWQQGYVDYICNNYIARPGHMIGGLAALAYALKYLR